MAQFRCYQSTSRDKKKEFIPQNSEHLIWVQYKQGKKSDRSSVYSWSAEPQSTYLINSKLSKIRFQHGNKTSVVDQDNLNFVFEVFINKIKVCYEALVLES